uniref:Bm14407 n=1 Tax=Brugia malayi TaxID=6279 RepID=A0A1I9G336_BRUMA|nr:Bm14407 [Brugia malayi]
MFTVVEKEAEKYDSKNGRSESKFPLIIHCWSENIHT